MNYKNVFNMLGNIFLLEGIFILLPLFVSILYGEANMVRVFIITIAIVGVAGSILKVMFRKRHNGFCAREGFTLVVLAWLVMSLFGAIPFYMSGEYGSFTDAFFETVSGFTTTGASVNNNVEALSKGLMLWRSFTHWLGGMGVLVFVLALMPGVKGKGDSLHVLRAESPGPSIEKMTPKLHHHAALLYIMYMTLTVICIIFLMFGGMNLFDAACIGFGTAGTGGFGIRNDSLASYSPYIQNVVAVFMLIFGINFNLYFLLLIRKVKAASLDEALRGYLGVILSAAIMIFINI